MFPYFKLNMCLIYHKINLFMHFQNYVIYTVTWGDIRLKVAFPYTMKNYFPHGVHNNIFRRNYLKNFRYVINYTIN